MTRVREFYRADIETAASRYGLDPDLVEAVVEQESAGDPFARRLELGFFQRYMATKPEWDGSDPYRWASSVGLMQVMPTTALEHGYDALTHGPESLFNPRVNLDVGCRILRELLVWSRGDLDRALGGYNGGKGGWARPMPQRYAREVRTRLAIVKNSKRTPA